VHRAVAPAGSALRPAAISGRRRRPQPSA
jgi:hypothetical protein